MKKTKVFSFAIAAIMSLTSLPVLSVSAEDTMIGDVDGDGFVTGHDSAVVSRYIYEDASVLSEEQKAIADINGDGIIDQTDLEWIHENEVWAIGDAFKVGPDTRYSSTYMYGGYVALCVWSRQSAGGDYEILDYTPISHPEYKSGCINNYTEDDLNMIEVDNFTTESTSISRVNLNLCDANGDGVVSVSDAWNLLMISAIQSAGGDIYDLYPVGRYDYSHPNEQTSFNP